MGKKEMWRQQIRARANESEALFWIQLQVLQSKLDEKRTEK